MDLDQLRGFFETARHKSFTRAAEKLFLTQPAISLQVKALETELGERLFERHGKRVILTEAGRRLMKKAQEIFETVEAARQEMADLRELRVGRVSVGASDTNCAYVLPRSVTAYRKAYPGVEIRLMDRMSPGVERLVLDGVVDFGLATFPVSEPRLESDPLFDREDVVIFPPGHPIAGNHAVTLKDLSSYPLLLLERGSTSRALMDRSFLEAGFVADVAMELGSIEVIKRFVEIGLGIALVPKIAVASEVREGRVIASRVTDLPIRSVGVVKRAGVRLSQAAEVFLHFLRSDVSEGLEKNLGD